MELFRVLLKKINNNINILVYRSVASVNTRLSNRCV